MYGKLLIKKEAERLIEGSIFSTTKNEKTLKIAYKNLETKEKGKDYFGFEMPEVGAISEVLIVRDRMVYKDSIRMVEVKEDGVYFIEGNHIKWQEDVINFNTHAPISGQEDIIFVDELNMNLFKHFYGLEQ